MGKKKPAPLAFCFGDPEPVLSGAVYEYLGVWLLNNGRYYATPVPWSGLARLLRANAYHGPILEFKTNMAMRGFRASAALTRRDMHAVPICSFRGTGSGKWQGCGTCPRSTCAG